KVLPRELARELGVSTATVSLYLKLIGKIKKLDKWIPHELNELQKTECQEAYSSLLLRKSREPFLDRIITCNKK
ncbi:Histone-lysine N-methyltransferase SETMAR, partial [Habropoda laboriosa]